MICHTPSRRAVLAGAIAAPAMTLLSLVASASTAAAISPELSNLIHRHAAADQALSRFYAEVFNPAVDRSTMMRAAIPHITIPPSPRWRGDPAFWSTNHAEGTAMAKALVAHEPRTSRRTDVVCARKLIAAMHRRARAATRVDQITGLQAANEREDVLYAPFDKLRTEIQAFPVRSLADLQAKLDFIERDDSMDSDELLPIVLADVARIAAGQAS